MTIDEGRLRSCCRVGRENKGQRGELNVHHLILAPHKEGLFDRGAKVKQNSCCDASTGSEPFLLHPGDAGLLPCLARCCFLFGILILEPISGVSLNPPREKRGSKSAENEKTQMIRGLLFLLISCFFSPVPLFWSDIKRRCLCSSVLAVKSSPTQARKATPLFVGGDTADIVILAGSCQDTLSDRTQLSYSHFFAG